MEKLNLFGVHSVGFLMPVLKAASSKVTRFIKKLCGGSQPILVEADDGLLYVAKFVDNLQGPNLLFNECAGAELYRACGLQVPSWKPLLLSDEFLDHHSGAWMETERGLRRPVAGLCFGSRYLGAENASLYQILPATAFGRILNRADFWLAWLLDICADHADNRQALFVENSDGRLLPYFIDHGHLFGGAGGNAKTHFIGSRYLDPRIYPQLSSRYLAAVAKRAGSVERAAIRQSLSAVPDEWKTPQAFVRLDRCLQRLTDQALLSNLLDTMVDAVMRRSETDGFAGRYGCRIRTAVLRPRVQPADSDSSFAICRFDRLACGQG